MWVTYEVDTGPTLLQKRVPIGPEENAGTLTVKLSEAGGTLLAEALERLRQGEQLNFDQPETGITYAPPISPDMRLIHWDQAAEEVAGWIRGLDPRPGAYTLWEKKRLRLFGARVEKPGGRTAAPGTVLGLTEGRLEVACGQGTVSLKEMQQPGHKRLPAEAFLRGHNLVGQILGLNLK